MLDSYLQEHYDGRLSKMFAECDMEYFYNKNGRCVRLLVKAPDYDFLFIRFEEDDTIVIAYGMIDGIRFADLSLHKDDTTSVIIPKLVIRFMRLMDIDIDSDEWLSLEIPENNNVKQLYLDWMERDELHYEFRTDRRK